MSQSPILLPIVALAGWSMLIFLWMGYLRVSAVFNSKIKLNRYTPWRDQMNTYPPEIRWKGDNYNNLMEQPTIFYAVALVLAIAGAGEGLSLILAWIYVGLRIAHSLVHVSVNNITWRFGFFGISSFVLIALVINGAIVLLQNQ